MHEDLQAIATALDHLDRRTEKVETILLVRDPGSSAAAEAYDGLRKQVVSAISDHLARLTQLAQMDYAIRRGADGVVLRSMVDGWIESSGLVRVSSTDEDQADVLYELVEDLGGPLEVLDVAYVESSTGRVIRQGRARRGPADTVMATDQVPVVDGEQADVVEVEPTDVPSDALPATGVPADATSAAMSPEPESMREATS